MFYTSYFGNRQYLEDLGFVCISIARRIKPYYKIQEYKVLAPSDELLEDWKKHRISEDKYIQRFRVETLDKLDLQQVLRELEELIGYDLSSMNIVFLCYELPKQFCHRHEVAKWFISEGIPCSKFELES